MIILFFLTVHLAASHRLLPLLRNSSYTTCTDCKYGPVNLRRNFSVFGESISQLYIRSDGVVHKENCFEPKHCQTLIAILNFDRRYLTCHIYQNEVTSPLKLEFIDKHVRILNPYFKATWAYTIMWIRVGDSFSDCIHKNSYQIIFTSNDKENYIIFNYHLINFLNQRNLTTGIWTSNKSLVFKYEIKELFEKSNVGEPGLWIYQVDNNSSQKNRASTKLLFLIILTILFKK